MKPGLPTDIGGRGSRHCRKLVVRAYDLTSLSEKTWKSHLYRYYCKGSTFYSFILRPWVEVRPGIEPRSPNWYRRQRTTTLPQLVKLRFISIEIHWTVNWHSIEIHWTVTCMYKGAHRSKTFISPFKNVTDPKSYRYRVVNQERIKQKLIISLPTTNHVLPQWNNFDYFLTKDISSTVVVDSQCTSLWTNQVSNPVPNQPHIYYSNCSFNPTPTTHSGVNSTLTALRQRFWIPRAGQLLRKLLRKCVTCRKLSGNPTQYQTLLHYPNGALKIRHHSQ